MRRNLKETFDLVQRLHSYASSNPDYILLTFSDRDGLIAGILDIETRLVKQARQGIDNFVDFKNEADSYLAQDKYLPQKILFQAVQCYYKTLREDNKYKNSTAAKLDKIIAMALGYSPITITQARTGTAHFRKYKFLVDRANVSAIRPGAERTFARVRSAYSYHLKINREFSELPQGKRDELIAERLRIKKSTVIAVRCSQGAYKSFGGFIICTGRARYAPHIRKRKV